jgi:2-iminobutanoate/2-iminopropanoate deaminase
VNLALFLAIAGLACAETKDLVYVSGRTGVSGGPGARAQTLRALRATRLNPKSILNTTVYMTDLKYLPDVDRGYRDFFRKVFPARTVLVAGLRTPGALVEISAIAVGGAVARRVIRPADWLPDTSPASAAAEAAGTLYLSALRPVDPATGKDAGASIEAQTEQVMKNQESVLRAAGFSFSDLVLSRIYLSEPSAYAGLNEGYRRFVTAPPPARATIHARAAHPGELLQIQSIAVRGSGTGRPWGVGHTSPIHSFSVKAGPRLYITGMTGRAPDGRFAPEIRGQTRQALATIAEQLERHGLGFQDVVETTIWLRDLRDFEAMLAAYRELVPQGADACTVVGIPPTANEALVEIQMMADSPR